MMTTRQKAILGLAAVFVIGGIIGAAIVGLVVRENVQSARSLRERDGFLRFVEHRLELTEAQRDSLADELDSLYTNLASLRKSTSNELAALLDSFRVRVEPQLTPHQRELLKRQEEFMRHGLPPASDPRMRPFARRGPPPGGGPPGEMDAPPPLLDDVPPGRVDTGRHGTAPPRPYRSDTAAPPRVGSGQVELGVVPSEGDSLAAGLRRFQTKLERLREHVATTPQQNEAIRQIVEETLRRARIAREEFAGQPFILRRTMHRLMGEARRKVFDVLTPEQRRSVREMRGGQNLED